ncbi:hypothetical protein B0T26DRAFT_672871 [Lasiosphaeria miniovina]|uniref:Uncharacterized protein n=1 Tax=Lasiosphaeria miniovina TaxID=1954250 RepID=A0AA40B607_9PEZI|nr:uncharacterized protein B0T26DRAFT_672871 [Lasiosphaeria miniovina]KAK0728325.1 hypothetical protein B0T26DRAFT_672871 [Lasiosphaeria miniovina]
MHVGNLNGLEEKDVRKTGLRYNEKDEAYVLTYKAIGAIEQLKDVDMPPPVPGSPPKQESLGPQDIVEDVHVASNTPTQGLPQNIVDMPPPDLASPPTRPPPTSFRCRSPLQLVPPPKIKVLVQKEGRFYYSVFGGDARKPVRKPRQHRAKSKRGLVRFALSPEPSSSGHGDREDGGSGDD